MTSQSSECTYSFPGSSYATSDVESGAKRTVEDLNHVSGSTVEERVEIAIKKDKVVVIGKSTCPFTIEARRTFDVLGVDTVNYNVDGVKDGPSFLGYLKIKTSQKTVPYVFVGGKFVGGCDTAKAELATGALDKKLRAAGVAVVIKGYRSIVESALAKSSHRALGPFFHFPEAIDERASRWAGFFSFVTCLLVAIYWRERAAHWVMCGLLVDFVLRFVGGGNFSVIGSLSAVMCSVMEIVGSKPKYMAGPPKQLAAFCGVVFAALAALFFLVSPHGRGSGESRDVRIVGLAFTCGLGGATFLEGIVGICLGFWMLNTAIWLKLCPPQIYEVFTSVKAETEQAYFDLNKRLKEPKVETKIFPFDPKNRSQVDYSYKPKTENMTREAFHCIKYTKITHFLSGMGLAGFACAWKFAAVKSEVHAPRTVYYAVGLGAAIWNLAIFILYGLKLAMYPRKCCKEWMCNLQGNSFVIPFVNLVFFAYIVFDMSHRFAKVLFWMGAPASLLIATIRVGGWIASRKELEHVNAAWMIMPVTSFVSAGVGPILDPYYRDAMKLWFASAFLFMCFLMVISFFKAVIHTDEDDRARPALGTWIAAPSIAAVAYASCYEPQHADFVFTNFFWFAVVIMWVFLVTFYKPFQGRLKFTPEYWGAGFPSAALARAALQYNELQHGNLAKSIAIIALAMSSYIHCCLVFQTIAMVLRRRFFNPSYKWGPLSFMRLTHEVFRGAVPRLKAAAEAASKGEPGAFESFASQWEMISLVYHEHSKHEDLVIFAEYEKFFPGVSKASSDEHEAHHAVIHKINDLVSMGPDSAAALPCLVDSYCADLLAHLRGEEDNLQGIPRRYIPLALSKRLVEKSWDITPAPVWFKILPYMLDSMPSLTLRVRFLKTLLWSMPYRAQQIGLMVGLGVDAVQWKRITDELPEIIPRGAHGWQRYY